MNKKNKDEFEKNVVGLVSILIGIILLFVSVRYFYIGIHNVDLVYNYQNLALEQNKELYKYNLSYNSVYEAKDKTSSGKILSLDELYSLGHKQELYGFGLMFSSGILFMLGTLIILMKPRDKEIK